MQDGRTLLIWREKYIVKRKKNSDTGTSRHNKKNNVSSPPGGGWHWRMIFFLLKAQYQLGPDYPQQKNFQQRLSGTVTGDRSPHKQINTEWWWGGGDQMEGEREGLSWGEWVFHEILWKLTEGSLQLTALMGLCPTGMCVFNVKNVD